MYLLADPIVVPDEERVTVVLSSENLLLNAYLQQDFGEPLWRALVCLH